MKYNLDINPESFQVKGLKKRWLLNIVGVVLLVVILAEIILAVFVRNYYYTSVSNNLDSRINSCSEFMREKSTGTSAEFENAAKEFINSYTDKNIVEVQFINSSGEAFISSKGYINSKDGYNDYLDAFQSDNDYGEYIGKNSNNEKIMAKTALMPKYNGTRIGAIRFIVSLEKIERTVFWNILILIAIGVIIIVVTVAAGLLFLKSILEPIKAITTTAFRIANGNFDDRLPVNDTDEIGKLCDTINYMASELESTEKLKNDFISSVSHELRTPLTVIQGWSETVKSSVGIDNELVKKGVDVINGEVARLSGLVEDLLDFSRMQSGRLQIRKEKVDVLAELGEAVLMYQGEAAKKGLELEFIYPEMLPPIMADPARLKQVFINIIDNAIKYSSNSGGTVMVEASQYDNNVQVKVSDMGCGIAAEDLSKVKEKFYKANNTVRGSGIGLAIADEIIKQHDGILMVDSKEGAGTTVTIVLPFIKPEVKSDTSEFDKTLGEQNERTN
ncbi:MAG: HAMP domain-containing sensor histidine kinase [Acutalibacteraceae bacterium]|nr:HAMP domain-containing sensor histidine kinase [Acutalibacteraceae bacterium]